MFNVSTKQWTWMAGYFTLGSCTGTVGSCGQAGRYGNLGVAATANTPGGRTLASGWVDQSGNLWLFGGTGYDSLQASGGLNDLWKFDPSTAEWTWMAGANIIPCPISPIIGYKVCRASSPVYGIRGLPAADNVPAGGSATAAWTDQNGNFWLFGGSAPDVTGENENSYRGNITALWVFNPSINEWAWMGGDYAASNCSVQFLYPLPVIICDGAQGTAVAQYTGDAKNVPASRSLAAAWTDKNGSFWLFGGQVTNLADSVLPVNDLWTYQPSTTVFPIAAKPIFSLRSGTYARGGPLTISNGMPNATIYYTTDGTIPTTSSNVYTAPIDVSTSEIVRAKAIAPGYRDSDVGTETYVVSGTTIPATPTFSVTPGTYTSVQTVTISDTTPGASIYYTTDGTAPQPSSAIYTGPITVASSETINALGVLTAPGYTIWYGIANPGGGYIISSLATAAYVINLPQTATPSFSIAAGTYSSTQTVTIADATAGANIYYTLNGAVPTTSSPKYTAPINVTFTSTLRAMAVATGYAPSTVATATYTINLIPPDFSLAIAPASTTVTAGQNATATVTVTPLNGFSSAVSFSCSGLPAGATCTFTPATVTPAGAPTSVTLTITTPAVSAALGRGPRRLFPGSLLSFLVCSFAMRRKQRIRLFSFLVPIVAGFCLIGGCGSASSPVAPRQPVTSNVSVIGTAGSQQHIVGFSLTVN